MSEKYTEEKNGIVRESDGAFIPHDPDNRDYQPFVSENDIKKI